jgi:hypothetical protein
VSQDKLWAVYQEFAAYEILGPRSADALRRRVDNLEDGSALWEASPGLLRTVAAEVVEDEGELVLGSWARKVQRVLEAGHNGGSTARPVVPLVMSVMRDGPNLAWALVWAAVATTVVGALTGIAANIVFASFMLDDLADGWAFLVMLAVGTAVGVAVAVWRFGRDRIGGQQLTRGAVLTVGAITLGGCSLAAGGMLTVGSSDPDSRLPWQAPVAAPEEGSASGQRAESEQEPDPELPELPELPEPRLSAEERAAEAACEIARQQVDDGSARGPWNSFLQSHAGRANVAATYTEMRARCQGDIDAWQEVSRQEFAAAMEESLAEREQGDGELYAGFPEPLGRCLRQFNEAAYLSPQALAAAECIADELAFGGTTPTDELMRQVTGEMLFHATWATWDEATRDVQCRPIRARGFDAAEDLGIATVRTWNDQLAAAGATRQLDDYAMVLDFLDTCEQR